MNSVGQRRRRRIRPLSAPADDMVAPLKAPLSPPSANSTSLPCAEALSAHPVFHRKARRVVLCVVFFASFSSLISAQGGFERAETAGRVSEPDVIETPAYVRTLEGEATLRTEAGEADLEVNMVLVPGDQLQTADDSKVEVVLPDGTSLKIDSDSAVTLDALPTSPLGNASTRLNSPTLVKLSSGEIQVTTPSMAVASNAAIEVHTAFGVVRLQNQGVYCVRVPEDEEDPADFEVLTRYGSAEIDSSAGRVQIGQGQRASYEGPYERPHLKISQVGELAPLEQWARDLDREAEYTESAQYVEPELRRQAASLDQHGAWVEPEAGTAAWKPDVDEEWSPYTTGHWQETPAGLSWVAAEPWGWVTHHYGSWVDHTTYGWTWYPGATYSPAWVYWYWGPSHVAWTPVSKLTGYGYKGHSTGGHYGQHRGYADPYRDPYGYSGSHGYGDPYGSSSHHGYGPSNGYGYSHGYESKLSLSVGFGFRQGVYGWIEADLSALADWIFCPTERVRGGRYRDFSNGHNLRRRSGHARLAKGLLTTETHQLTRARWTRPDQAQRLLADVSSDRDRSLQHKALPDVTSFVDRRRPLDRQAYDRVVVERASQRSLPTTLRRSRPTSERPSLAPSRAESRREGPPAIERAERTKDTSRMRAVPSTPFAASNESQPQRRPQINRTIYDSQRDGRQVTARSLPSRSPSTSSSSRALPPSQPPLARSARRTPDRLQRGLAGASANRVTPTGRPPETARPAAPQRANATPLHRGPSARSQPTALPLRNRSQPTRAQPSRSDSRQTSRPQAARPQTARPQTAKPEATAPQRPTAQRPTTPRQRASEQPTRHSGSRSSQASQSTRTRSSAKDSSASSRRSNGSSKASSTRSSKRRSGSGG